MKDKKIIMHEIITAILALVSIFIDLTTFCKSIVSDIA